MKDSLPPDINSQKRCPKCELIKGRNEFGIDRNSKSGLASYCKQCHKKYALEYRQRDRKKKAERDKRYRARHLEKAKACQSRYRAENVEKEKERIALWRKDNPERMYEHNQARRARERGAGGRISAVEWRALLRRYGNKCLCCRRSDVKLTRDHVLPLTLGGTNTIDNVQPLCGPCNSRKNARHIDYR